MLPGMKETKHAYEMWLDFCYIEGGDGDGRAVLYIESRIGTGQLYIE